MNRKQNLDVEQLIKLLQEVSISNKKEIEGMINNSIEIPKKEKSEVELITCKEAAKLYPIGEQRFRELCKSKNKKFPSVQIGCRHYIIKSKLDEWFADNAIGMIL